MVDPGRVATWVWPWPVTVMLVPKTKVEMVSTDVTVKMVMPPRMPMVLDGVLTVIGAALADLSADQAEHAFGGRDREIALLGAGSNTKRSMTSCALGPTVSEVPSRKSRCARSLAWW